MKKLFKAAASLAIGCAMLQASAFASIDASESSIATEDSAAFEVTVSGVTDESTILVTKRASGTEGAYTLPSDLAPADIVYINQLTATEDGAEYSFNIGDRAEAGDTLYFFAGGTNENAAVLLGTYTITEDDIIYGDVDGDGDITTGDAIIVLRVALGASIDGFNSTIGDVDGDEDITTSDAILILRVALGNTSIDLNPNNKW